MKENVAEKKPNFKEKAYRIIKDKIIKCEFAPGDILDEKQLVKEIGASRTPIREALNKIEQENLIRIIPKRGVFVCEITPKDLTDLFQVREQIGPFVTRLATPHLPEEELLKYRKLFTEMDKLENLEVFELDNKFHHFIVSGCKNKYFMQLMENIYVQNQRIRILSARMNNRLNISASEHLNIIECLLKRDADGAAEEMRKHVIRARDTAYQVLLAYRG